LRRWPRGSGTRINGMSPIDVWAAVECGASDGRKMAGHRGQEVTLAIYASFRFGPGSAGKAASQLSLRQRAVRRGGTASVLSDWVSPVVTPVQGGKSGAAAAR